MTSTPDSSDQPDPFAETQIGGPVPNLNKDQPPQFDQVPPAADPFQAPATGNPFQAPAARSFEPPVGNPFDQQPQYGQAQYGQPDSGQQFGQQQFGQQEFGQYGAAPSYGGAPYQPGPGGAVGTPPDNNLVSAILLTVVSVIGCFGLLGIASLVLGIMAIVKANAVNSQWSAGDAAGAQRSADDAKKFANIGWIICAVSIVIFVLFLIIGAAAG